MGGTAGPICSSTTILPPERMVEVLTSAVQECGEIIRQRDEDLAAARARIAELEGELQALKADVSPDMAVIGARSLRDTMRWDNFSQRAKHCWDAMRAYAIAPYPVGDQSGQWHPDPLASLTSFSEEDVERVANTPEVKRHFCGSCKAYKEHEDAIRAALTAFVSR